MTCFPRPINIKRCQKRLNADLRCTYTFNIYSTGRWHNETFEAITLTLRLTEACNNVITRPDRNVHLRLPSATSYKCNQLQV